jgi:hypothetical protein
MVQDEILMDKVRSDAVEKAKLVPPLEMPAGIRERTQALLTQGGFQARRIRSKKYDATLDIALGKSLNKMRGIEMSGLRPEHFVTGFETDKGHLDRELTEEEFKESYFQLLKSDKLSKQEHDVRCDLFSYCIQQAVNYKWAVVRLFHDALIKNWERGLSKMPDDFNDEGLEKYKSHYFDGSREKLKEANLKTSMANFGLNVSVFVPTPKEGGDEDGKDGSLDPTSEYSHLFTSCIQGTGVKSNYRYDPISSASLEVLNLEQQYQDKFGHHEENEENGTTEENRGTKSLHNLSIRTKNVEPLYVKTLDRSARFGRGENMVSDTMPAQNGLLRANSERVTFKRSNLERGDADQVNLERDISASRYKNVDSSVNTLSKRSVVKIRSLPNYML